MSSQIPNAGLVQVANKGLNSTLGWFEQFWFLEGSSDYILGTFANFSKQELTYFK